MRPDVLSLWLGELSVTLMLDRLLFLVTRVETRPNRIQGSVESSFVLQPGFSSVGKACGRRKLQLFCLHLARHITRRYSANICRRTILAALYRQGAKVYRNLVLLAGEE